MTQEILNNSPLPEEAEPNKMTKMEALIREIEKVKRKVDDLCEIRKVHLKEMETLQKVVGTLCQTAQRQMACYYFSEKDHEQGLYWVRREDKTAHSLKRIAS